MNQGPAPRSPEQAILLMRIIGASLGTGVTLFAFVSWFLHQQENPISEFSYGSLAYNGFLALAVLVALGATFLWRWRVAPLIEEPHQEADWQERAARIQTGLIVTWALVEGAALVGEVVYFLTGNGVAGVLGVVLIWGGIGMTWPKRDWL